jgi:hypothetical protein
MKKIGLLPDVGLKGDDDDDDLDPLEYVNSGTRRERLKRSG